MRQIERLNRRLAELEQTSGRYSWARLVIFLLGASAVFTAYFLWGTWPFVVALVLAIAAFVLAVRLHRGLEHSIRRHVAWRDFKQAQVARATHDWANIPPSVTGAPRFDHPFEADLDLVGEASVHRLLNTAVSQAGGVRLRALLADPQPDAAGTELRQARVASWPRVSSCARGWPWPRKRLSARIVRATHAPTRQAPLATKAGIRPPCKAGWRTRLRRDPAAAV